MKKLEDMTIQELEKIQNIVEKQLMIKGREKTIEKLQSEIERMKKENFSSILQSNIEVDDIDMEDEFDYTHR